MSHLLMGMLRESNNLNVFQDSNIKLLKDKSLLKHIK